MALCGFEFYWLYNCWIYIQFILKLKNQEKQLQVVQSLENRSSGYTKVQAQASEKRLTQEISVIKKSIQNLESELKKKKTK